MKFGEAFATARKAGKKEFTWRGKRYHTRTADEEAKTATAGQDKVRASASAKTEKATASSIRAKDTPPPPRTETRVTAKAPPKIDNPQTSRVGERYARAAKEGNIPGRSPKKVEPAKTSPSGRVGGRRRRRPV